MAHSPQKRKIDWQNWISIISVFVALLTYISASQQFEKNYQLSVKTTESQNIQDSIDQAQANEKFVTQLQQQNEQFERNKDLTDEQIRLVNKQLEYYRRQVDIQNLQLQVQKDDLDGKRKLRIKEIMKRLTELQTQLANSGVNFATIYQTVAPEMNNLIDEATAISDVDASSLAPAEYNTIVQCANSTNKTDRLEDLIKRGLENAKDAPTIYALKNHAASYYIRVKRDYDAGRRFAKEVIEIARNHQVLERDKTANIAYVYYLWSGFEYDAQNYLEADTLIKAAESLVVTCKDAWRYQNYPVTTFVKNARLTLDSLKAQNRW